MARTRRDFPLPRLMIASLWASIFIAVVSLACGEAQAPPPTPIPPTPTPPPTPTIATADDTDALSCRVRRRAASGRGHSDHGGQGSRPCDRRPGDRAVPNLDSRRVRHWRLPVHGAGRGSYDPHAGEFVGNLSRRVGGRHTAKGRESRSIRPRSRRTWTTAN